MRTESKAVVISSPGDVGEEWNQVDLAIRDLNLQLEMLRSEVRLTAPRRFGTHVPPGFHPQGVQRLAEDCLEIENCDFLIAVFNARFGTPVDGYGSGTEREIELALEGARKHGKPQLLIYFCSSTPQIASSSQAQELARIHDFKKSLGSKGIRYYEYSSPSDLRPSVLLHLSRYLLTPTANLDLSVVLSADRALLRAESLNDLVAPIGLKLTSVEPARKLLSLDLYLNTNVTNADWPILEVEGENNARAIVEIRGTRTSDNSFQFVDIPVVHERRLQSTKLTVSNVRANVNQLGIASSVTGYSSVAAALTLHDGPDLVFEEANLVVGLLVPAIQGIGGPCARVFSARGANDEIFEGAAMECAPTQVVEFEEFFPGVLRTRTQEAGRLTSPRVEISGTRVGVWFDGVPYGVRVLVTESEIDAGRRSGLALRRFCSSGYPGDPRELRETASTIGGARLFDVPIVSGQGFAEWEWVLEEPLAFPWVFGRLTRRLRIGIVVVAKAAAAEAGLIRLRAGLAPTSTTSQSRKQTPMIPMFVPSTISWDAIAIIDRRFDPADFEELTSRDYPTLLEEQDGVWTGSSPAVPGVRAKGESIESVRKELQRLLQEHVNALIKAKEAVPRCSQRAETVTVYLTPHR